jgi:CYTH domain-containing protein
MSELSFEIERKYLLRGRPPRTVGAPSVEIDQGYIPGERIRERVRRARGANDVRYYRTIKMGAGIQRIEIEEEAPEEFFQAVWPLTVGRRVHKRRYLVDDSGLVWEIDEFLDRPSLLARRVGTDSRRPEGHDSRMAGAVRRARSNRRPELHEPRIGEMNDSR